MRYVGFSKQEVRGILLLVFFLLSSILLNHFIVHRKRSLDAGYAIALIDSFIRRDSLLIVEKLSVLTGKDPNVVSFDTLVLAGFDSIVSVRWVNYREKGGRFKRSSDILKVYGIDSFLCSMSASLWFFKPVKETRVRTSYAKEKPLHTKKRDSEHIVREKSLVRQKNQPVFKSRVVELNSATADSLLPLYGIGPVLSKRIIKFRKLLGGYISVMQLKEVYGLRATLVDSLSSMLQVDLNLVERQNLKTATYSVLVRHPYIDKELTRFLLDFRAVSDRFTIEEYALEKNVELGKIKKIAPYVEIN